MIRQIIPFLVFCISLAFFGGKELLPAGETVPSVSEFQTVPDDCRPWAYYFWIKGNVTKESITADLTRMKELGFGGVLVFDSRGYHEDAKDHVPVPVPIRNEFMSVPWQDLIVHLVAEADRLGMKVSLNLSNTGGYLRGPWDFAEKGPRTLITSTFVPNPAKPVKLRLLKPVYQRYYKDAALLAIQVDRQLPPTEGFGPLVPAAPPKEGAPRVLQVRDISDQLKKGELEWTPPEGETGWLVVRFGSVVIGETGSVDILNPEIIAAYYDKMAGTIQRRAAETADETGTPIGKSLVSFYNVSWEGGNPNWTDGFDKFFAEKRGYDLLPYLPVLAGLTAADAETNRRFMVDFHKTVADAFCENCYRKIGELCHRDGKIWHSEDGGPWNRQAPMFVDADMLTFWGQNDIPQGEFWVDARFEPKPEGNTKFAASASHIYGHGLTSLEAFTHMTRHWTLYPALLKPAADLNLIDGGNMFIWHTYTAPVPEAGKPGIEYFAGTHINSNVTWQGDVGPFLNYIGRCQAMLRTGLYTADFAVYVSDRNYRMWGRGAKWNAKSGWGAPAGTAYDLFDTCALVNRLDWKDGRFVLPDGMSYKWLVFDPEDQEYPLASLKKIVQLANSGGHIILGPDPPVRTNGLSDGPDGDTQLAELVRLLWGDCAPGGRPLGNGMVYTGMTPDEVMAAEKVSPDFEGPFEYHHRSCADGDIYFVVNTGKEPLDAMCRFRSGAESASCWNPMTGEVTPLETKTDPDGSRSAAVRLPEYGSCFVVFGNALPDGTVSPDPIPEQEVCRLNGPWKVRFDPAWGGPAETLFEELTPWNEHSDPSIRYYSGTAEYETAFSLSAEDLENRNLTLDIGRAAATARIFINGTDAGVLWMFPWQLPLGKGAAKDLLHEGENRLVIRVTNTWANRLIGDAALPPEERFTETNAQFYPEGEKHHPWQGFAAGEPLCESGLFGPVRILK